VFRSLYVRKPFLPWHRIGACGKRSCVTDATKAALKCSMFTRMYIIWRTQQRFCNSDVGGPGWRDPPPVAAACCCPEAGKSDSNGGGEGLSLAEHHSNERMGGSVEPGFWFLFMTLPLLVGRTPKGCSVKNYNFFLKT
jgi:hypothetical protein